MGKQSPDYNRALPKTELNQLMFIFGSRAPAWECNLNTLCFGNSQCLPDVISFGRRAFLTSVLLAQYQGLPARGLPQPTPSVIPC